MTVTATHNEISYTAGAGATVFPYTFLILASADLLVYKDTVLQVSGYTVSSVGVGSGGNVTFTTPLVGGEIIRLLRSTEITQEVDLLEGSRLPADQTEGMWDKLTLIAQDLDARVDTVESDLSTITIGAMNLVESTVAGLPAAGESGLLRHVTDDVRGIWMDTGTQWFPTNGGMVNVAEFPGSDLGARFNAACAALTGGGTVVIPPGTYTTSTQLSVPATDYPIAIWAYGVTLKTTGAISALHFTGGSAKMRALYGVIIDQRQNAAALYGVNVNGSWNTRLYDVTVLADGGVDAAWAGVRYGFNGVASNAYWGSIHNLFVRKQSGADPGSIPLGVLIDGAENVFRITGGAINSVTTGILFRPHPSVAHNIAGGPIIDGVDFEDFTTAIKVEGTASSTFSGYRVMNCSADLGTTFVDLAFSATPTSVPQQSWIFANRLQSNVTNYLVNPQDVPITALDHATVGPNSLTVPVLGKGLQVYSYSAVDLPISVKNVGGDRGFHIVGSDGVVHGGLVGGGGSVRTINLIARVGATPQLRILGLKGISGDGSATNPNNLRGIEVISDTATEGAVLFGTAESDTNYYPVFGVEPSASAPGVACWMKAGTKATTGFTIELSGSPGAGNSITVNWILVR